ncbi:cytochrome c biogenesis heme-transporting ATPase CcmA [Vibrio hippocampi]|uniref:Cytochrome c biogenesis ATP-binding export protein CcmA n=1 Tax=Vibrio hippocampi TaxID=654686 RepID=A0ABN8DHV5_9VIBR|nr:cytochrome c biogenesis heme-transporting ATPase CcmA [Vibrio hippocampi]CAH0525224.1 Cytochrome c biogenesis ATP-binding export protein CcmA [Vibrio hippocampi]
MLEVNQLTAIRDDRVLFSELSFSLHAGDLVQIEGRNGTGKTTLMRIIAGLGDKESGEVSWCGEPVSANRDNFHQSLLFIGHLTGVKRELTAYENLRFSQSINKKQTDKEAIYDALTKVGLAGKEDIPVAQLSAGQQRRVALARLWLSEQTLWILDEPLTAIDKQGVKVLEQLFLSHTAKGGIILLTTHQDMLSEHPKLKKIKLGD